MVSGASLEAVEVVVEHLVRDVTGGWVGWSASGAAAAAAEAQCQHWTKRLAFMHPSDAVVLLD